MFNLPEAVTIFVNENDKEKKLVFENDRYKSFAQNLLLSQERYENP